MRGLMTNLWILLALFPAAGGAAEGATFAGRPLADALAQLQADGLHIVYSSAVVTPSMTVDGIPVGRSDGWLLYVTRAGWPRTPKLVPCP